MATNNDTERSERTDDTPLATPSSSSIRRRRKKSPWIVRKARRFKWFLIDLSRARQNANAAHSARFILEDLNHPEGVKALAEISGLPEGVIVSAMFNICCDKSEENDKEQA